MGAGCWGLVVAGRRRGLVGPSASPLPLQGPPNRAGGSSRGSPSGAGSIRAGTANVEKQGGEGSESLRALPRGLTRAAAWCDAGCMGDFVANRGQFWLKCIPCRGWQGAGRPRSAAALPRALQGELVPCGSAPRRPAPPLRTPRGLLLLLGRNSLTEESKFPVSQTN